MDNWIWHRNSEDETVSPRSLPFSRALPSRYMVAFPLVTSSRHSSPMCPSGLLINVSTLLDLAPSFWTCYALSYGGTPSGLRVTRNGRCPVVRGPTVPLYSSAARRA